MHPITQPGQDPRGKMVTEASNDSPEQDPTANSGD